MYVCMYVRTHVPQVTPVWVEITRRIELPLEDPGRWRAIVRTYSNTQNKQFKVLRDERRYGDTFVDAAKSLAEETKVAVDRVHEVSKVRFFLYIPPNTRSSTRSWK